MKSLFRAVIGRLAVGIILLSGVTAADAQTGADRAVVKYLGAQDDMLVFNVSYYNPQGARFVVAVRDQNDAQLYQGVFKEKSFYRQFKLPKTDKDRITFVFNDGQDQPVEKTFQVNVNSRFVQEVAIKKL